MPGSAPRSVWIFTAALIASGTTGWCLLLIASSNQATQYQFAWPIWAVATLFVAGKFARVDLTAAGTERISVVMTDAAFVAGLLLGPPASILIGQLVAALLTRVVGRGATVKLLFNFGQELVGTFFGTSLFLLLRTEDPYSAQSGLAALAAGGLLGLTSQQSVAVVTRLASGQRDRTPIKSLMISLVGSLGNGAVALQVVFLGSISPVLAAVPLVLVLVLLYGYRGLRDQQRSVDRTELLYKATAALHETPSLDDGIRLVLQELRQATMARSARIILLLGSGAASCTVEDEGPLDDGLMTSALPSEEDAARQLASALPGVVLARAGLPATESGPLAYLASADSIVAPLIRGGEPAGIVIVQGDPDAVDGLGQSDVDLVEIIAKQIGLALEKGRLERSLRQLLDLEDELTRQAYFDPVTGLPNRNFLSDELRYILDVNPTGRSHAVVLLDLDDFKTVNDSLGHVAGDELLAVVSRRLLGVVGERGFVTRIGGDEFALVVWDVSEPSALSTFASDVSRSLNQPTSIEGREVVISSSLGIRITEGECPSATELLRDADLALYEAKSRGKGQHAIYNPTMHAEVEERLTLSSALAHAVEREEFLLVFQPIFDLDSLRPVAAEALVRWRHPERGVVPPSQFLGLTEESGVIVELGKYVLAQAVNALSSDFSHAAGSFYLSVNVSPRQLKQPDFAGFVLDLLRAKQVSPSSLVLEITESIFIDNPEQTDSLLRELSEAGVRISLDDFGTGYSSLSQLQKLPIHQLKIDQSFVRRLAISSDSRAVVGAIIQLAQALDLDLVAEGVEHESQRDELRLLGCSKGQGWLFSRPRQLESMAELLRVPAVPLT